MIVAFDPVAREVIVDFEDERLPIGLSASRLIAKFYADDGIFYAELVAPDTSEVSYYPCTDAVPALVRLEPLCGLRWRLMVTPIE
jgi:hypothetical protein